MANYQTIVLDTTTPQLRAPGTGDGYSFNSGATTLGVWTTTGLGIGTSSPSYLLSLSGDAARTVGMERHTTANTAGNNLTLLAGGATSGATDKAGGTLALSSGTSTGVQGSAITFSTASGAAAGTSDNSPSEKMRITATGNVGIGTNSPTLVTPYPHTLDIRGTTTDQNFGGAIRLASNNGTTTNSTISVTTNGLFLNNTLSTPILFFTNNTERARIDSSGRLLVGTTTAAGMLSVTAPASTTYGTLNAVSDGFGYLTLRNNGTDCGYIGPGALGSGNQMSVASAGATPLIFGTNTTERMRIISTGSVLINTAAIATTATDGFLYIPGCAGTPTGVPTTQTGRVPLVVDTTNNKLYFYSGGAWRDAGP